MSHEREKLIDHSSKMAVDQEDMGLFVGSLTEEEVQRNQKRVRQSMQELIDLELHLDGCFNTTIAPSELPAFKYDNHLGTGDTVVNSPHEEVCLASVNGLTMDTHLNNVKDLIRKPFMHPSRKVCGFIIDDENEPATRCNPDMDNLAKSMDWVDLGKKRKAGGDEYTISVPIQKKVKRKDNAEHSTFSSSNSSSKAVKIQNFLLHIESKPRVIEDSVAKHPSPQFESYTTQQQAASLPHDNHRLHLSPTDCGRLLTHLRIRFKDAQERYRGEKRILWETIRSQDKEIELMQRKIWDLHNQNRAFRNSEKMFIKWKSLHNKLGEDIETERLERFDTISRHPQQIDELLATSQSAGEEKQNLKQKHGEDNNSLQEAQQKTSDENLSCPYKNKYGDVVNDENRKSNTWEFSCSNANTRATNTELETENADLQDTITNTPVDTEPATNYLFQAPEADGGDKKAQVAISKTIVTSQTPACNYCKKYRSREKSDRKKFLNCLKHKLEMCETEFKATLSTNWKSDGAPERKEDCKGQPKDGEPAGCVYRRGMAETYHNLVKLSNEALDWGPSGLPSFWYNVFEAGFIPKKFARTFKSETLPSPNADTVEYPHYSSEVYLPPQENHFHVEKATKQDQRTKEIEIEKVFENVTNEMIDAINTNPPSPTHSITNESRSEYPLEKTVSPVTSITTSTLLPYVSEQDTLIKDHFIAQHKGTLVLDSPQLTQEMMSLMGDYTERDIDAPTAIENALDVKEHLTCVEDDIDELFSSRPMLRQRSRRTSIVNIIFLLIIYMICTLHNEYFNVFQDSKTTPALKPSLQIAGYARSTMFHVPVVNQFHKVFQDGPVCQKLEDDYEFFSPATVAYIDFSTMCENSRSDYENFPAHVLPPDPTCCLRCRVIPSTKNNFVKYFYDSLLSFPRKYSVSSALVLTGGPVGIYKRAVLINWMRQRRAD